MLLVSFSVWLFNLQVFPLFLVLLHFWCWKGRKNCWVFLLGLFGQGRQIRAWHHKGFCLIFAVVNFFLGNIARLLGVSLVGCLLVAWEISKVGPGFFKCRCLCLEVVEYCTDSSDGITSSCFWEKITTLQYGVYVPLSPTRSHIGSVIRDTTPVYLYWCGDCCPPLEWHKMITSCILIFVWGCCILLK